REAQRKTIVMRVAIVGADLDAMFQRPAGRRRRRRLLGEQRAGRTQKNRERQKTHIHLTHSLRREGRNGFYLKQRRHGSRPAATASATDANSRRAAAEMRVAFMQAGRWDCVDFAVVLPMTGSSTTRNTGCVESASNSVSNSAVAAG